MKTWIKTNILTTDGISIISKRCRKEWFDNNGHIEMYSKIIELTDFLPITSSLPERIYCILNDILEISLCTSCNVHPKKFRSFKLGYSYCSNKCTQQSPEIKKRIRNSNRKKYGKDYYTQTDVFKKKSKKTWLSNYGVDNPSKSKIIKNKKIKTCNENFGVDFPQQSKTIRKKSKRSNIEKYGVENVMQSADISSKVSKTRLSIEFKRFYENINFNKIITPLFKLEDYNGIGEEYEFKCNRCKKSFLHTLRGGKYPRCYDCYPNKSTSLAQVQISDFIKSLGIIVSDNDKTVISPKELDIYIPQKNIAIEYNGLYYHSEMHGGKSKKYHLEKTIECENNGIKLIHIYEDDWLYNRTIIKNRLKHVLGKTDDKIYARNCEIVKLDTKQSKDFLNKTHLQGYAPSSIYLGLSYNDDLVSVMSFSKRKILDKKSGWELIRFSSSTNVVGSFSKLLSYFEKTYDPDKIISYSLRDWSTPENNIYLKNGFDLMSMGTPNYHYIKNDIRVNRINFQKHKLKDKLETFDPKLTEWDNMKLNGYDRIWDCGSMKYEKTYPN